VSTMGSSAAFLPGKKTRFLRHLFTQNDQSTKTDIGKTQKRSGVFCLYSADSRQRVPAGGGP
jgi:hypothetical protein